MLGLGAPVERAVLALAAPLRRPRAAAAALTVRAGGRRVGVGELQAVARGAEAVGVGLRLVLRRARRARRAGQGARDGARQRLDRVDGAQGGGARGAVALRRQRAVLLRVRGARPQRAHGRRARLVPRARRLHVDDALASRCRRAAAGYRSALARAPRAAAGARGGRAARRRPRRPRPRRRPGTRALLELEHQLRGRPGRRARRGALGARRALGLRPARRPLGRGGGGGGGGIAAPLLLLGAEALLRAGQVVADHLLVELVPVAGEQQAGEDELALALHGGAQDVEAQLHVRAVLPGVAPRPAALLGRRRARRLVRGRRRGLLRGRRARRRARLLLAALARLGLLLLAALGPVAVLAVGGVGAAHLAVHQAAKAAHVFLQLDAQRLAEAAQLVGHRVRAGLVLFLALLLLLLVLAVLAIIAVGIAAHRVAVRVH